MSRDPGHTAIGTWSGGRFMHFGVPLEDDRLAALLAPGDDGIRTVLTADTYGTGEADTLLGTALQGTPRDAFSLIGAVGHDIYDGEREGPKGFPRFTDPRLRGPEQYGDYLKRATEQSLERLQQDQFDVLLLHNPDRTGYTSTEVWDGMQALKDAGLTRQIGVAPGPANGFTLDVIDCLERFGDRIDWAMVILNPLEPWPGELVLPAAARHDVDVICRVVDYGGLFHDDLKAGTQLARPDHRAFRPAGWVDAGLQRIERMRPVAEAHGLTPLQLACHFDLAHAAVKCVVPTLIQEGHEDAKPIEAQRADLAGVSATNPLTTPDLQALRELGDNTGSMLLKGGTPDHDGEPMTDRWALDDELRAVGERWGIDPERQLRQVPVAV